MKDSVLARFESKYEPDPTTGCWLWTAGRTTYGYGSFRWNGVSIVASRASYSLYVGHIPEGMKVCHRCDTPACVNPAHLFLGTDRDNVDDMLAKGRHPVNGKTHCLRGHAYDEANTYQRPDSHRAARRCRACNAEAKRLAYQRGHRG